MARKKIKLEEKANSEILVADTDLESGAEASNVEDCFEEEEEEGKKKQQASAEVEPQAASSGGLHTWGPPQGRNTNIHSFVGPAKGVKKGEAPHITKTARQCLCSCCFSQKFFICWLNRPTYTTSNA